MSTELTQNETMSSIQEESVLEVPLVLVVGGDTQEQERLAVACEQIDFAVQCVDSFAVMPGRDELDPDLIIVGLDSFPSIRQDDIPSSLRQRIVWMVGGDDWSALENKCTSYAISAQATSKELAFRLPAYLRQIQEQAWSRLGLPHVGSQEVLWEMIPSTDWVTGLDNRLRFLQELQKNVSRSERYKRPFCCLLVRFVNYDEVENHQGGRERINYILEEVAGLLEVSIRDADFLARMQKDLFGLLLPETDLTNGQYVIDRIRTNLKQFQFSQPAEAQPRFLCGMSAFDADISTADQLLQEAQRSLESSESSVSS